MARNKEPILCVVLRSVSNIWHFSYLVNQLRVYYELRIIYLMVNQVARSHQPGAKVTLALPRVRLLEVVRRVRAFIQEHGYGLNDRLPPERQLAESIAVS